MNNNWFWNNKFMGWVEGKLLVFTNWFWNKRHVPVKEPAARITPTLTTEPAPAPQKKPARKPSTKKPVAKKTQWTAK